MIYLIQNGVIHYDYLVDLQNPQAGYSTTKNKYAGKWYYEFEHINGTNFHLAGWRFPSGESFHFYPQGETSVFKIYYTDKINVSDYERYDIIPFQNAKEKHTIGLAYDVRERNFTMIYKDQVLNFVINSSYENDNKVEPCFFEGRDERYFHDFIKVNFGYSPFKYKIPEGYLPWCVIFSKNTVSKRPNNHIFFIIALTSRAT